MTRPLKFLFVANTVRDLNAGASGCDIATIEALRERGHEVDEVWADDMPRRIAHHNLHQLLELPRNFANVVKHCCSQEQYDVVQVNQPHAWRTARQHRKLRLPGIFINRSHGWEPALRLAVESIGANDSRPVWRKWGSRLLWGPLEKHNALVARWSDGIVACSATDKQFIVENYDYPAERILTFIPGIPEDFLGPPAATCSARWKRILHVSNFCRPKAPEIVAAVYRRIAAEYPDAELTWVTAQQDHGAVRILLKDTAPSVRLLDFMPREELRRQFDHHGIFLLPSHFEGFGLVFLEAMARGMCVLGTPVGGLPGIITSDYNGVLVERNNSVYMFERALELLRSPGETAEMGTEARRLVKEYTWTNTAKNYVNFCQTLRNVR